MFSLCGKSFTSYIIPTPTPPGSTPDISASAFVPGFALTAGTLPENLSVLDPVSPPGEAIRFLFILVTGICLFILAVVWAVLFWSIFRFRARPDQETLSEPPQVYGSLPIEIAWTVAPTLIVFLLALAIIRTTGEVRGPARPPAGAESLRVTVVGHQWWWEYVYEEYNGEKLGFITANELHLPAGESATPRPIYLTLKSADVCHSWWTPRLAGKMDLIPGRTNRLWFQTDRPGLYLGQCAEYCGTQHAGMLLRVYVDTPSEFQAWLDNQKRSAVEDPKVADGKKLFLSQSCINCHRVRGTAAAGTYAPDLTHLMSRETLASGMILNTRENLRRWVVDPQSIKQGCLMPAFGLDDKQVDSIVEYLLTLK